MSYLLRMFSSSKWLPCLELDQASYEADAVTGCTRTSKNTLSVWHTNSDDFESEHNKKLITALALSMTKAQTFDVVLLDPANITNKGIEIVASKGQSLLDSINTDHRDLSAINLNKLGLVGDEILMHLREELRFKRVTKAEVIGYVFKHLDVDFEFDDLNAGWQKEVTKQRAKN